MNKSLYGTTYSNLQFRLGEAVKSGDEGAILAAATKFGNYYNEVQDERKGFASKPNAEELASLIGDSVNGSFDHEAFALKMKFDHRTIQQNVMGLALGYIRSVAKFTDQEYDGRNHASVMVARAIVKAEEDGLINLALPLV